MRYAIIGCGRISPNHFIAAQANKLEIVAVCDINASSANAKLEKFGILSTPVYVDYIKMIEEQKPELVAIATESGKHARIALDCINHGINVIIEKPIALSIADARAVIEAGKKNGVKVCACHQNRFNKAIMNIRSSLEEGRFGKLFYATAHIRWNRGQQYYEQAKWRGTWEQDGGALMNQCIHNIDLLRWMLGDEITEVFAYTDKLNHDYIDAEDLGIALVKAANGAYGIIEGTTDIYPCNLEETLYIFGEKGTVKAGGQSVNFIEEWKFADLKEGEAEQVIAQSKELPPNVYGFGHTRLYEDMIDAIVSDRKPYVDGEAGLRALETVLAIYKSKKEKRAVTLPLEDFSTLDMKGTF